MLSARDLNNIAIVISFFIQALYKRNHGGSFLCSDYRTQFGRVLCVFPRFSCCTSVGATLSRCGSYVWGECFRLTLDTAASGDVVPLFLDACSSNALSSIFAFIMRSIFARRSAFS